MHLTFEKTYFQHINQELHSTVNILISRAMDPNAQIPDTDITPTSSVSEPEDVPTVAVIGTCDIR